MYVVGEGIEGRGPLQTGEGGRRPGEGPAPRFRIHVLFTTPEATKAALQHAEKLSEGLNAEIALILTPIVPYPLPLDQPPTSLDLAQEQICSAANSVEREVVGYILLCRDPVSTLEHALRPHSLVLIGARPRWGLSKTERLARALRRRGHDVILEPT
jgi:hypothetical protein